MNGIPRLPGYGITERLYAGARTLVYRGVRERDACPVAIKLLRNPCPSFNELVQFRNQYAIATTLDLPSIVKMLALEPYGNAYALIMEDFGGISLKDRLARSGHLGDSPSTLITFLQIAIQIAESLDGLYRHRVIHKDLKPANILIHPDRHQIKLIDFSIASLLPRETPEIQQAHGLEGTLAYLSPEQTGRMNRGIDYRSDFYALGVTFYELLTGQVPFIADDPMELVHCHLAKSPLPVHQINRQVPLVVSEMIGKLIAKNAEDRYQSALGLKHDLETCLHQLKATGNIIPFALGQRDLSDRFLIPEKLYGRATAVQMLLDAFDRVSAGTTEMVLVAGFSGIGKTAVVNEVHKPIVRQRGYFIKGKFDQFQRNIPFSAVVQALRDLMGQLLNESDAQLAVWKSQMLAAVGETGQVILDVIPELAQLIGQQPAVPALSGTAAQNRFNLLLQKFIQVFTTADHPLVVFLDDLQWADSASLNLITLLMNEAAIGHLLILGAYRDNEVAPVHPLMLMVAAIKQAQAEVQTITLAALSLADTNQLIADTLGCAVELARPLSELVDQKTQGNPFFTTQFLKVLHGDRLITFDGHGGHWQCDLARVRSLALTDDVVEFMALQLQKLPAETQAVLKLAACVGAHFDLPTLAIVRQRSPATTAADLWTALQSGLILPTNEVYKFYQSAETPIPTQSVPNEGALQAGSKTQNCTYRFLHDRVQQAAYSLIPSDQKQATHRQIGQLLQQATPDSQLDAKIFEIVNHLNQGAALIQDQQEQQELAQLNLTAGKKARRATAYGAALDYFNRGIGQLRRDRWQQQYSLTLALYEGATEAAYLSTDFEQMEQLAAIVLTQAHSWRDRVPTYEAKIQACIAQNRQLEALRLAREVLQNLGVVLPEHPTSADVEQALQATQTRLKGQAIAALIDLPQMTAPEQKAAMVILSNITAAAYQVAPRLLPLLALIQVDLSMQYGNAAESTYGYVQYGLMLIAQRDDVETGYRFGQLGIDLLQRINTPKLTAKTIFGFNNSLRHWREPAKDTLTGYLHSYASGLEAGDLEYVALSLMCYSYTAYFSGQELSALKQTMNDHRQVIQRFRQHGYLRIQSIYYQAVLNLLETSPEPDRLCSEYYDEDQMIQLHLNANQLLALYQLYFNKLLLAYLFQRYEQALEHARSTEQYLGAAAGLMHIPIFYFYDALVRLAIYPKASEVEQTNILERVAAHQEKLRQWAIQAPSNQAHRCALVAAERCRVLGQNVEASEQYDRAITLANEHEYRNEASLANELAAQFYLGWHKERIAQEYLIAAYYSYARWGAKAKVIDLEQRYPQLLAPILQQERPILSVNETVFTAGTVTSSSLAAVGGAADALDLAIILKASQTLSSEIELGKLLSTLLKLIIENAGANKCVLLLLQDQHLLVTGLATAGAEPIVLQQTPVDQSPDVPLKLIYAVKNRVEPVVLMDATNHPEFATDPYCLQHRPQSILCSPILHQGNLLGLVYLENNLTAGAFTGDRVQILNLLCAQATISLENARLYRCEQEKSQALHTSLEALRQSELRFKQLFQQSADAVFLLDNSSFIDCNQAAIDLFGFAHKAQFCSTHLSQMSPEFQPDGASSFDKVTAMIALARCFGSHQFEWVHQRKNGETFWAEVLLTLIPYQGTQVLYCLVRDIGDRKRAEKSLKLTQFAIDHASLPAWWVKSNGQLMYANAAACHDLGYTPAEILDRYVWDFNPEFSSAIWEAHRQETKDQGSLIFESINMNKSGTIYPVEVTVHYIQLEGEEYHFAFVRNIGDRKQAEQEQARLLAILEVTTDIVGMADAEGKNIYLNQAGQKILQIPAEESNQFHIFEVIAPSEVEAMETKILPTAMHEGIWSGETMLRSRSGEEIPVSQVLMTHKNAQGEIEFLSTIIRDIRETKRNEAIRQRIESASKAFQERLTFLIQQTPLGVIEWNLEFKVVGWNPSAEKIFGYRAAEMLHQPAVQIVPEADRPHVFEVMQGLIARQSGHYSLNQNIRKDGSLITCEWINTPLLNSEEQPIGIFSIVQDVSDRKAADLAIQQKTEALEHTLQKLQHAQLQIIQGEKMSALGNLVAGVAHEINNPVGFIAGNLQPALDYVNDIFALLDLYQQEYPNPSAAIQAEIAAIDLPYVREDLPKLMASMRLGVNRIRDISTSLRTFSRADKDYKVPFKIHEGIDSTVLILKHRLKANSDRPAIEVVTDYGNLPPIECFPGQLNQVFMNILANAIDALEEASQKRTFEDIVANPNRINIQTRLHSSGKQVVIQIRDNGMGMSEHVKQRVFDHLFTTKAVGKGTGLGLTIAHQIVVEKHGGILELNSTLGQGVEFMISIPVQ